MAEKQQDQYSRLLEIYDNFNPSDIHERRMAYKPLYDYFQKLILEIGTALCQLNEKSLRIPHLKTRWEDIKPSLAFIEDPSSWNGLINEMNNIRSRAEHNDYYDPPLDRLDEIRAKAPKFKEWLIRVGREYYKQSRDFGLKEAFYHNLGFYISEGESLLEEFGDRPHIANLDMPQIAYLDMESYEQLPQLLEQLRSRKKELSKLDDIKPSDLEDYTKLVRLISKLREREDILVRYYTCPKCGGKIKETQHYFGGGTEDQPEPDGVYIRVGCQECDYLIHDETIDI